VFFYLLTLVNKILTGIDNTIDSLFGKYHKYQKHIIGYVLGAIGIGFIMLTVLVIIFPHSFIDVQFSQEVQEDQNPLLDSLMKFVSWFGYFPGSGIIILSSASLFFFFKYRREALYILFTMICSVIGSVIKVLVNRPRPSEPLVHIVQKVSQQSFPSGHVLFYVVFFGFLTVLMYNLKTIPKIIRIIVSFVSMILIFAIPFSRIYLGAHWFTDVLGGLLVGILCLYLLCFFYFKLASK